MRRNLAICVLAIIAIALIAVIAIAVKPQTTIQVALQETGTAASSITPTASASTLIVNTLADTDDGNCDKQDCSLREAIENAPKGATINFSVTGTIQLSKPLEITKDISIVGPGPKARQLIIKASNPQKAVKLHPKAMLDISYLVLSDDGKDGGGIDNQGGVMNMDDYFLLLSSQQINSDKCLDAGC